MMNPMTMMFCGVLLLGVYVLEVAASEESTDTFIGEFPHVDPKTSQSPDQGGAQKPDRRTEFEKVLDRCVQESREVLSDSKLDVYADGKNRRYGSDKKVRWIRRCVEREGYVLPKK